MKEYLTVFLISAVCGFIMYRMLAAHRQAYQGKSIYALYLMAITGGVMTFAYGCRSLLAVGLVLIAYTILLALTEAAPASVFCLPSVWLAVIGNYLIGSRISNGTFNWTDCLLFELVAFLAILYPFMAQIQRSLDGKEINDEEAREDFIIRKNKNFVWAGVISGLIAGIILVYIH